MQNKTCILVGNCQCSGVREFLQYSEFFKHYNVIQYANWELINSNTSIPTHTLQSADLVIYQPLSDVYNCLSTNKNNPDSFLNILNETCNTISFPRIHNNMLFPIFRKNKTSLNIYGTINNKIESLEHACYLYNNDLIDYDFDNRYNNNYYISKLKETDCDVKIIDFIYKNIANTKLFLTADHPTSFVFNEVTKQICEHLELDYDYEKGLTASENITGLVDSTYDRPSKQLPISRYTVKHFGLKYASGDIDDADNFYLQNTIEYIKLNKLKYSIHCI
jgi:hypothetical protein